MQIHPGSDKRHDFAQNLLEVLSLIHDFLTDHMRIPMSPNYHRTLVILKHFGPDNMGSLAKKISVSKQQMTPIIDRLAKDGLIERTPCPTDRRIINIALTAKGDQYLADSLDQCRAIIIEKFCANATEEELQIAAERLKAGISMTRRWIDTERAHK